MAGRGYLTERIPVNTERLKVLRNGRWQPMYFPVNNDRAFSGACLAESFAEKYASVFNVDVGVIPCADGGSSLEQWQPGGLLFDNAVYQTKLAMRTSNIVAVLWHQGEADCVDGLYQTYGERFEKIMNAFRKELNLYDVPFILGGLGHYLKDCERFPYLKNYSAVNQQLKDVAFRNKMTAYVSAYGLTSNPDYLHFTAASLHEFGLRYFDVFDAIRDPNKKFEEKLGEDDAVRTAMERL